MTIDGRTKVFIFCGITLLLSTLYSVATLLISDSAADNLVSAIFCALTVFGFLFVSKQLDVFSPKTLTALVIGASAATHLGILIGFGLMDGANDKLWVFDTYNLHLPSASNIASFLNGTESVRTLQSSFDRIYATQIFVGVFFYLFGVNPIASGLALLVAKLGTIFVLIKLGSELKNEKTGILAAASYAFLPTITFYTTVFYKEAFIHLFVVSILYLGVVSAKYGLNAVRFGLLTVLLLLIANERFYLFPLFLISTGWVIIARTELSKTKLIGLATIALLSIAGFVFHFSDEIRFSKLFSEIARFKSEYNAYSDVDKKWNADLLYPLGIAKLYLSPYFHPRKFEMFSDFSLLIIWGSFASQIILVGAAWQVITELRKNVSGFVRNQGFLFFPFFGFMAVFGYVAPFAGRLRDAFVPLLAIYFAAIFIRAANSFSIKFKKSKAI